MSRDDTLSRMYDGVIDGEIRALLQLSLVPGVGPTTVGQLLAEFGAATAAVAAPAHRLERIPGVGRQLADQIVASGTTSEFAAELAQCDQQNVRLLARGTPSYPRMLAEIFDPPTILYLNGDYQESDALAVGIVGTRHATRYGIRQAERLANGLGRAGVTVISGLARGIDAAAHRAALQSGGRTLAVMAGGLSEIYPPEHRELAGQIAGQGAVVSELPFRCKPRRGSFPRRNRLISGLSIGVVVIEAALRSGALITARHAMEQGREVFAVPGPVDSRNSHGCHELLRDGAKLVETAADILDDLGPLIHPMTSAHGQQIRNPLELQLNEQEQRVLASIEGQSTSVDEIVERSQLPVHRILATLSVLEMRHLIQRISGDRVARK